MKFLIVFITLVSFISIASTYSQKCTYSCGKNSCACKTSCPDCETIDLPLCQGILYSKTIFMKYYNNSNNLLLNNIITSYDNLISSCDGPFTVNSSYKLNCNLLFLGFFFLFILI